MMFKWFRLSALALGLSVAVVSNQVAAVDCQLSPEQQDRLAAVLNSAQHVGYSGTLLHERNEARQFVDIENESSDGALKLTRLSSRVGPHAEQHAIVQLNAAAPCELDEWYSVRFEPGQIAAGRATLRVVFRPRDMFRMGYVMDVDTEHNAPLRVAVLTPDGQLLERSEFATVEFAEVERKPILAPQSFVAEDYFTSVPPGFKLLNVHLGNISALLLSDGLSSVSVFFEPLPQGVVPGEGAFMAGSTLTYSRGKDSAERSLVTVMGEVPLATARLLADSLKPKVQLEAISAD